MGTVTQYNLANVQAALGGSNPISMSEYYRGGAYVPTSRTTTVREPTSGEYYASGPSTWWEAQYTPFPNLIIRWQGTNINAGTNINITSFTSGGYTYFRGSYRTTLGDPYGGGYNLYGLYRTSSSTTTINTGVPASGQISLSQLYGAANP